VQATAAIDVSLGLENIENLLPPSLVVPKKEPKKKAAAGAAPAPTAASPAPAQTS
jgi:hypothetical protein